MKFGKRHYRAQVDTRDCGVAALAMILEYYRSQQVCEKWQRQLWKARQHLV